MRHHTIVALLVLIVLLVLPGTGVPASDELDAQALVDKSAAVVKRFAADKNLMKSCNSLHPWPCDISSRR